MQHHKVRLQLEIHLENQEESALAHFTIGRECIDFWSRRHKSVYDLPEFAPTERWNKFGIT